jgi:4-amino-4-deoxy-L-arabinose transferase-like glycosyltransferase
VACPCAKIWLKIRLFTPCGKISDELTHKQNKIWGLLSLSPYLCRMSQKAYGINPWVVMAVFTVLVGPFALSFHMHYPDEMYYTDAAVKMLQNGDYLTTYLGSGELRFKKPILTYWAVLAGFKLFGVTPFASRIFFLIAGAATVGLTYLLSKTLFADRRIAGISALIMAANPVLIFSATRSIPDVLLVLTMTASAVGFAGLIRFGNDAPKKYLWILYISLALAFEVKGLPAAALGALGFGVLLLNPWNRIQWKTILYYPAILLGIFISLFWFGAMWKIHGPSFLDGFLHDQVGTRVTSRFLLILQNGLLAFLLLNVMFLPWVFFGLKKSKETLQKLWGQNPAFFIFAVVWTLAILGMGALTSKFYERYLLPVAPVIAVWIGWFLIEAKFEIRKNGLKIALAVLLILNFIVALFSLWLNFKTTFEFWIWVQIAFGLLVLVYLIRLFSLGEKLPKAISYSILLLFYFVSTATFRISLPDQGQQIHKFVTENQTLKDQQIAFIGNLHVSSKIRIGLGPYYNLVDLPREGWEERLNLFSNLIIEDKLLQKVDTSQYQIITTMVNWNSKAIPDLLLAAGSPEFESLLLENGKIYFWLEKK